MVLHLYSTFLVSATLMAEAAIKRRYNAFFSKKVFLIRSDFFIKFFAHTRSHPFTHTLLPKDTSTCKLLIGGCPALPPEPQAPLTSSIILSSLFHCQACVMTPAPLRPPLCHRTLHRYPALLPGRACQSCLRRVCLSIM